MKKKQEKFCSFKAEKTLRLFPNLYLKFMTFIIIKIT
jgi:hypothetical protein